MKLKITGLLLALTVFFCPVGNAAGVYLAKLSINQISILDLSRKVTLYKEMLPEGNIVIQGTAKSPAAVREVLISIDGRDTWHKADLRKNGAFSFRFQPELSTDYYIYVEAKDAEGKTNDTYLTRCQLVVADTPVMAAIRQTLDSMISSYQSKNSTQFMKHISSRFVGDDILLHRAIRRDFSALDLTSLRYSITNFAFDSKGNIATTLYFNRSVTSLKTGNFFKDSGTTQIIFTAGENGPEVYSMKAPLLFGLSDASNLITGTATGTFITVSRQGDVSLP